MRLAREEDTGRAAPHAPGDVTGSMFRVRAKVFAVCVTIACLLAVSRAPATGHAQGDPAPGKPSAELQPVLYDLDLVYNPATCRLRVKCSIDYLVMGYTAPEEQGYYHVFLPGSLEVKAAVCDPYTVLSQTQGLNLVRIANAYSLSRTPASPFWQPGDTMRLALTYEGTPADYDQEEKRYWSWATGQGIWVLSPWVWLPWAYPQPPGESFGEAGYDVSIAVPDGWLVFSPGCPAHQESSVGGLTTFHLQSERGDDGQGTGATTPPGAGAPVCWVAGPYAECGQSAGGGVDYVVWGLAGWREAAQALGQDTGAVLDFLSKYAESPPVSTLTIVQIPPEHGGGVAFPGSGYVFLAAEVEPGKFGNTGDPQLLWAHELTHVYVPSFDDGLAEYSALLYLAERDPEEYTKTLQAKRIYVLDAIRRCGDLPVSSATSAHAQGSDVTEAHAFAYSKPALVWNMFDGLYGREATLEVLRRVARIRDSDRGSPEWQGLVREAVGEVAGEPALRFFDRWWRDARPLDLAVAEATCRPQDPTAAAGGWLLSFTVRDNHREGAVDAGDTIPWVEVAITLEDADGRQTEQVQRVDLTGGETTVELQCPRRPVEVRLDPNLRLLDYVPRNDIAKVSLPGARAWQTLVAVAAGVGLSVLVAAFLFRRPRRIRTGL